MTDHSAMVISQDFRHRLDIDITGPYALSVYDPKPWRWSVRERVEMHVTTGCGPGSTGYADTREEAITAAYAFAAREVDGEAINHPERDDEQSPATVTIVRLRCTCTAAPSQWEGRCSDGDDIYIRFRHNEFTVNKAPDVLDSLVNFDDTEIYRVEDSRLAMTDDEMLAMLPDWIVPSPALRIESWEEA